MIFTIACTLAYFWSTYIVPETANVSLEEIDAVFQSSVGREDEVLKSQVYSLLSLDLKSRFTELSCYRLRKRWG